MASWERTGTPDLLNILAGRTRRLILRMFDDARPHLSPLLPPSVRLSPAFTEFPVLAEIVVMHPDYLVTLDEIMPHDVPNLVKISMRCSTVSDIEPRSSLLKLTHFLQSPRSYNALEITLFGPRLALDTPHLNSLRHLTRLLNDQRTGDSGNV